MSTCSQVLCTCKLVTHISVTRLHFDCSWKFRLIVGKKLHQYSTCTCFNWNWNSQGIYPKSSVVFFLNHSTLWLHMSDIDSKGLNVRNWTTNTPPPVGQSRVPQKKSLNTISSGKQKVRSFEIKFSEKKLRCL